MDVRILIEKIAMIPKDQIIKVLTALIKRAIETKAFGDKSVTDIVKKIEESVK